MPEDAGSGATPHMRAKAASDLKRRGLSPAVTRSAPATSGPTPFSSLRAGHASTVKRASSASRTTSSRLSSWWVVARQRRAIFVAAVAVVTAPGRAATLTDTRGYPIRPFDLTSGTSSKCGNSDEGFFRDLSTGLDGTPMPSFASALKPDQIWDLVHYIATLPAAAKLADSR